MTNFDLGEAVSAPDTSLAITYSDLQRAIGRLLGWGRDPDNWTTENTEDGEDIIKDGLRKFYTPPVLPGERQSHQWSFLSPVADLDTVSGQYVYDLPTDFAMLDGPLTYEPGSSVLFPSIDVVGEHQIRQRLQINDDESGRPVLAACRVKEADQTTGTRYELLLWPVPDGVYTLNYRYKINPYMVDTDAPYPLGGQPHARTLKEAVLSVAEEMFIDGGTLHAQLFLECLKASVAMDRSAGSPDTLGLNIDRSDYPRDYGCSWHDWDMNVTTYNGVAY